MTEVKHTPAPWKFEPSEYGYSSLWNPETRQEILATAGRNEGDYPQVWMGEELSDADKALIEAAPDLLEALEELLTDMTLAQTNMRSAAKTDPRWEGCAEAIQPRVDAARAAIAKAQQP